MQIQVNTDNTIEGHADFASHVRDVVESALSRFSGQITRIEVISATKTAARAARTTSVA